MFLGLIVPSQLEFSTAERHSLVDLTIPSSQFNGK